MARIRALVVEHLADPAAVLVLDESEQQKAGQATEGSKRQYVGCVGKVANAGQRCVLHVRQLPGACDRGRPAVPARQWAADAQRRTAAKVPEHVTFATKSQLAVQMLAELHHEGSLPGWITGDEVYGQDPGVRRWCQAHRVGYVLGVPRSFTVWLGCGTRVRAEQAAAGVAGHGWNYRSAGPGSKGERDYAWAWIATASEHHSLLVRRSLTDPTDLAFFYCYSPPGRPAATLSMLVRVAGMRWPVEENFQTGKGPLRTRPA